MASQPKHGRVFNTRAEALARALYLAHLVFACTGLGALFLGVVHRRWPTLVLAACYVVTAGVMRHRLARTGALARCRLSLDSLFEDEDLENIDPNEVERFETLLIRRDELERSRGTAGFDPWSALEVQRELQALVRLHPGLEPRLRTPPVPHP